MKKIVSQFVEHLSKSLGARLKTQVSEPYSSDGVWFIDAKFGNSTLVVQYESAVGFGLSNGNREAFETHPDEVIKSLDEAVERSSQLLRAGAATIPMLRIADLREGHTQVEVAARMNVKQPSYAKMEQASLETISLGTLKRIIEALNGEMALVVKKADGRVVFLGESDIDSKFTKHIRTLSKELAYFPAKALPLRQRASPRVNAKVRDKARIGAIECT